MQQLFLSNYQIDKISRRSFYSKSILSWEDKAHYAGLQFNDLVDEANKWVPQVRAAGADIIVVTAHSGEEAAADTLPENEIKAIATKVNGIDAIVALTFAMVPAYPVRFSEPCLMDLW